MPVRPRHDCCPCLAGPASFLSLPCRAPVCLPCLRRHHFSSGRRVLSDACRVLRVLLMTEGHLLGSDESSYSWVPRSWIPQRCACRGKPPVEFLAQVEYGVVATCLGKKKKKKKKKKKNSDA
eukprot:NODE_20286_length_805_cov_1.259587.p2 GENE.NODE_20286_length_805_cov_1.259587~~NODE_20286_length_805_cov_1.259587.p2  ORF type:complete len:122 (-),score=13.43 NODE_20286_length_805_cov_1.259587:133-498(-)